MKKLTKKLFISVMTLVLTAMALGTSTFAWFSMNTTVTAKGMQVQAKSNSIYLLIGDDAGIATDKTGLNENANAVLQDSESGEALYRYPAYYGTASEVKSGESGGIGWYSARNKNADDSTDAVVGVSAINSGDLNKYVLTYKVWLTLSTDSVAYNGKITCSMLKVSGSDAAIAAVVEINGENLSLNPYDTTYDAKEVGEILANAQTTGNVPLANNTVVEVTIRVYIDGTSTNVYSDYINDGYSIIGKCSIQFDLE